ncbi:MAG: hypothetical protein ACI857_001211 [Arenicella sp.]|jgi:hypothetical protein
MIRPLKLIWLISMRSFKMEIMNYLILRLVSRDSKAFLEEESIRAAVSKKLILEHVDRASIFWDEEGDIIFHPPIYKKDKNYWISLLNSILDRDSWEIISSNFQ